MRRPLVLAFLTVIACGLSAAPARAQYYTFSWQPPSTNGAHNPLGLHCHVVFGPGSKMVDPNRPQTFTLINQSMPHLPDGTPNQVTQPADIVSLDPSDTYTDVMTGSVDWPDLDSNPYGDVISITLTATATDGTKMTSSAILVTK